MKEKLLENIEECLHLCDKELKKRTLGVKGESTVKQLQFIIDELNSLKVTLNNNNIPKKEERYLISFGLAFRGDWCWDMNKPTELFMKLLEINDCYKNIMNYEDYDIKK